LVYQGKEKIRIILMSACSLSGIVVHLANLLSGIAKCEARAPLNIVSFRTLHANVREEMKANKEDLCRANVFIITRAAKNGTIPDEDTLLHKQE
ncbi:hypothetical protein Tco_0962446, partial [Tanacetum coccineum]